MLAAAQRDYKSRRTRRLGLMPKTILTSCHKGVHAPDYTFPGSFRDGLSMTIQCSARQPRPLSGAVTTPPATDLLRSARPVAVDAKLST